MLDTSENLHFRPNPSEDLQQCTDKHTDVQKAEHSIILYNLRYIQTDIQTDRLTDRTNKHRKTNRLTDR